MWIYTHSKLLILPKTCFKVRNSVFGTHCTAVLCKRKLLTMSSHTLNLLELYDVILCVQYRFM